MLLVPSGAPLAITLQDLLASTPIVAAEGFLPGSFAFGCVGDGDPLDDAHDPTIDRRELLDRFRDIPARAAPVLVEAILNREDVLDLGGRASWRPLTLFEHRSMADVVGDLIRFLPPDRVRIDRAPFNGLNHCEMGGDGIARVRLVATNGNTLAGRAHALVHELGHALIGIARHDGRSYRADYGAPGYRRFYPRSGIVDEEALVRAIADAWLLRRNVPWARTFPGAIDADGRDLPADALAKWSRARLAEGLGLPFAD
jgi:hypothetical protein